jgi:hypothetical protein
MQSLIEKLATARAAYETSLAAYKVCSAKCGEFYTNDERTAYRATALRYGQAYKHYCDMMHTFQQELNKAAFTTALINVCKLPAMSIAIDMLSEEPNMALVTTPYADENEAFGFV